MNSLPSSVNYAEVLPSLPENATRYSVTLQPTSGSKYNPSSQIQFQFPNRGYLIPDSIYLRYKLTISNTQTAPAVPIGIPGTPFFSPIQRLELAFGSVTVDSINNYHQVCNMLTNCTMDWSQKYGNAYNYGFSPGAAFAAAPTTEEMDGYLMSATGGPGSLILSMAGPLPCLLTNVSDKLLPLFAMPTISLVLTIDSLTNSMVNAGTVTQYELSNVELCFDFIELGSDVDAMVRAMGDKIYIKSQSFSNSSVVVPNGTSGSQSYTFNNRYASVKGAIVIFSGNNSTTGGSIGNGLFDARDITNETGSISLVVSGVNYPQKPYSMLNNKAAVMMELRKVMGSIYDKNNSVAINAKEYAGAEITTTNINQPAKFYIGFNLQKLHSNALLTGISTNNSNISVNVEQTNITGATRQCNLILAYDALIEIDLVNKQSSVKS